MVINLKKYIIMVNETNNTLNVLITSPSINAELNIGGISSLTKLLIENNNEIKYILFVRGKKDKQKRRLMWLLRQPMILFNFLSVLINNKKIRIVHINYPLIKIAILRDTVFVLISSLFRKKIIVHFHGGNYNMNKSVPHFLKLLIKISMLFSDRIITLGNSEKKFFIEFYKTRPEKIIFLHNAVTIPNVQLHKTYNHKLEILFLSRIDKDKGLKEIVLALKMLKEKIDFKLIIAGDGPDKNDFLNECQKQIAEHYEYVGIISGEKKQEVLNKTNIFLMPSYYEGLPLALLEAMANKLIPIVTPVGSIPEIIEDRKNGFLVPTHDFYAIYNCIIELIENPKGIEEIGNAAYNTIISEYLLDDQIIKLNKIYSNLIPII